MNVIIVNDYAFVNGGAGSVAINMAKLLAKYGNNVILFTAVGPIDKKLQTFPNLKVICLYQDDLVNNKNRLQAVVNGLWNCKAAIELKKILSEYKPCDTIVHIHTLSKALSTSIILLAKRKGFKIIYQMHDYGIACPNMGFFDYKSNTICVHRSMSLECIVCNCDKRSYWQKLWRVMRQVIQLKLGGLPNKVDCLISVSNFSLKILKPYIPTKKKIEVLPNIINIKRKDRVKAEENKKYIFIGRLMKEKNPNILAYVGRKLGLEVVFVGAGSEEQSIRNLNSQAIITGWLNSKDISQYMNQARALVFTSKCYECHPLTVLEALAYGIPVITSDGCAAIDQVIDGVNGRWFKNNDVESLCDVLEDFYDDNNVAEYSQKAYKIYWNNRVEEKEYYDKLVKIYRDLID